MPPDNPPKVDPWKVDDWRDLVRPPEYRARESVGRAIARRIVPPLFLVVGPVFLLGAVHESGTVWHLEWSGARAPGVVRSFEAQISHSASRRDVVYLHPVVTYTTSSGQRVSFKDPSADNPSPYRIGETVTVLYRADQPSGARIDRGIWNWLGAAALYVMGGGFTLSALAVIRGWGRVRAPLVRPDNT